jgi:hypothetical protein
MRLVAVALMMLVAIPAVTARAVSTDRSVEMNAPCALETQPPMIPFGGGEAARGETLWIFDADFEDLVGDNAGWISYDRTGTPGSDNYWHVDTIRTPLSRPYLGDYTWWCGTYALNDCWVQQRGYGNSWICCLERDFPEIDVNTDPGDQLQLEWDQRYAIEKDYDYGYVDVSTDNGANWTTVATYSNGGFMGTGGIPANWGDANGHPVITMDAYAGEPNVKLRFRFGSDPSYSSYGTADNSWHSVLDGAW